MRGPIRGWLRAEGSLTMHLRRARAPLTVQVLGQGREPARAADARPLRLRPGSAVLGRTVLLVGAGRPMVLAHSVVRAAAARGPWRSLGGLGSRPLAELLFTRADVGRSPLWQEWLPPGHPLARWVARTWATAAGQPFPGRGVWRRWSCFERQGQSLLVSEFFVPGQTAGWPARARQRAGRYRRSE